MADNSNDDGEKDLVIDRSHIGCDWCGKPGPTKNCSRCLSYYYCNRQCQLNHWKNHKEQCAFLKDKCEQYKDGERIGEEFLKDKEDYDQKEKEECAICLEEIELPISLECGHIFCVSCLVKYHVVSNDGKSSCPNCRGDMPEVIGSVASKQMIVYIERAKRSHGTKREVYLNLALQQIEASMNIQSVFQDQYYKNQMQMNTSFTKCGVYSILDMHHEVIEKVDEFMKLCASTQGDDVVTSLENIIEARIAKAKAYLGLEEWQAALDTYQLLYEDCKEQHQGHCCDIAAGISRAQYELQNYHEASVQGCRAAYRDNRFRAGVHKYVALSQMKMGDFVGAKKSITRGILHEEQWDEKNRKENEEVLRMILAEEAKKNKPKGKKKGKKKGRGKK